MARLPDLPSTRQTFFAPPPTWDSLRSPVVMSCDLQTRTSGTRPDLRSVERPERRDRSHRPYGQKRSMLGRFKTVVWTVWTSDWPENESVSYIVP